MLLWSSWLWRFLYTEEIAGSSPARSMFDSIVPSGRGAWLLTLWVKTFVGSNPSTVVSFIDQRIWFNGRIVGCQSTCQGSIPCISVIICISSSILEEGIYLFSLVVWPPKTQYIDIDSFIVQRKNICFVNRKSRFGSVLRNYPYSLTE